MGCRRPTVVGLTYTITTPRWPRTRNRRRLLRTARAQCEDDLWFRAWGSWSDVGRRRTISGAEWGAPAGATRIGSLSERTRRRLGENG